MCLTFECPLNTELTSPDVTTKAIKIQCTFVWLAGFCHHLD